VKTTLAADLTTYTLTAGGYTPVLLDATTYHGKTADVCAEAEMVILSGNDSLVYDGGILSATKTGAAEVMFRLPVKLGGSNIILYIYTAPVTVQVN
jgi:hypothetical protein